MPSVAVVLPVLMRLTHARPAAACKISVREELMKSAVVIAGAVLIRRDAWWSMHVPGCVLQCQYLA